VLVCRNTASNSAITCLMVPDIGPLKQQDPPSFDVRQSANLANLTVPMNQTFDVLVTKFARSARTYVRITKAQCSPKKKTNRPNGNGDIAKLAITLLIPVRHSFGQCCRKTLLLYPILVHKNFSGRNNIAKKAKAQRDRTGQRSTRYYCPA